jgi:hypothetical protein
MDTSKSILSFDNLISTARKRFSLVPDLRRGASVKYPLCDVLMSGLAMFHFQCPSLLSFQKELEEQEKTSNLATMFGVSSVPKSSQMRTALDKTNPDEVRSLFNDFHRLVDQAKILQKFRVLNGYYLGLIDGSGYFSSDKCNCPRCLEKEHKNGTTTFHHQILQCVLAKPGLSEVLPLDSEEIRRQDGHDKQDCELNAGKRIIERLRSAHPHMDIIIVGDGLYSHVPFVLALRKNNFSFLLVAKPDDHVSMMNEIKCLREAGGVGKIEFPGKNGGVCRYEYASNVPLKADCKETTNWFSYVETDKAGKIIYQNSWITDLTVTAKNVAELANAARCRWKIENEGFNTLKNQGYHIEHNFGHGKENLSFVLFLLNLCAFFIHEILELSNKLFRKVREKVGARYAFWERIRSLVNSFVFPNWDTLLLLILKKRFQMVIQPL